MFSGDDLKGKWKEVKGEFIKKWGQLTDDELEKTKGNFTALVGLLQQKLGMKKDDAHDHLTEVANKYRQGARNVGKNMSDKVNQSIDKSKDKLKN